MVFAAALRERGLGFIHVSSGGVSPLQKIALGPGYQVHLAERIKRETGLPTIAVGLITDPKQAEGHHRLGPGGHGRPGARHPLRSALALACGRRTRRHGERAAAILALPAARHWRSCSARSVPRSADRGRAARRGLNQLDISTGTVMCCRM
jgi:hypothetical protein